MCGLVVNVTLRTLIEQLGDCSLAAHEAIDQGAAGADDELVQQAEARLRDQQQARQQPAHGPQIQFVYVGGGVGDGDTDDATEGTTEGITEGTTESILADMVTEGTTEGITEGTTEEEDIGLEGSTEENLAEGTTEGTTVGEEGTTVGEEGTTVGEEGTTVGEEGTTVEEEEEGTTVEEEGTTPCACCGHLSFSIGICLFCGAAR